MLRFFSKLTSKSGIFAKSVHGLNQPGFIIRIDQNACLTINHYFVDASCAETSTTGIPNDIASITGRPNDLYRLGKRKMSASA